MRQSWMGTVFCIQPGNAKAMRTLPIQVRTENVADADAIRNLTAAAFRDAQHASGTEVAIIDALRRADALTLSLVALDGDTMVGHVAFSPATDRGGSGPWFTLGPVSVLPARQRSGIGSLLIRKGIAMLRHEGAAGCVLVGNPDYYRRFGFEPAPDASPSPDYAPYFMTLPFTPVNPRGPVDFHPAFGEAP